MLGLPATTAPGLRVADGVAMRPRIIAAGIYEAVDLLSKPTLIRADQVILGSLLVDSIGAATPA
jgi:hypothetical protein